MADTYSTIPPSVGGPSAPTGAELLAQAAEQKAAEEALAATLMEEPLRYSETLGSLFAALSVAQGAIQNATRDSKNPFFKSKYASLAAVRDACREPLAANGLAIIQLPTNRGRVVIIPTLLGHASGEWIESRLMLTAAADTPQNIVAAITYGRRAGLAAMVGVAPEDDDGETAEGKGPGKGVHWDKAGSGAGLVASEETVALLKQPEASIVVEVGGVVAQARTPLPTQTPPRVAAPPSPSQPQVQPSVTVNPPPPGFKPPARMPGK